MKWKPATPGEDLFLFLREDAIPSLPSSRSVWFQVSGLLGAIGGSEAFDAYFRGAIAIHAMRRLVRHCTEVIANATPTTHVKLISDFASEDVLPGLTKDSISRLARLVLQATRGSGREISRATSAQVIRGMSQIRCYLCGLILDVDSSNDKDTFFSLDHIWPQSIGGESKEENLLPACKTCQQKKADSPSWEWINVHNLVWPSQPSAEACEKMPRETRIARYFFHVTELAARRKRSLKDILVELGKMNFPSTFVRTGLPMTFFDLETVDM